MAEKKEEVPKSSEVPSTASGDQNKITGLQVAAGRAAWEKYGDKESDAGYVFKQNRGFVWKLDMTELDKMGVTMESIMDCMKQLEALGSADELKKQYAFRKNQGFVHPGLVIQSKLDPRIKMAVALHDPDYEKTDVLLGWFVDDERIDSEMKVANAKYQPERPVDDKELQSVERAREAAEKKESIKLSPEEEALGLTEAFEQDSFEMFRSNKKGYLGENQGGKMDAKKLTEMKEAGIKIVDATVADIEKPGLHLTNPTMTQLEESVAKAQEEGYDTIFVHRSAQVVKRKSAVEDLNEGIDFWGLPDYLKESEGTPMEAGGGIGDSGKKVGKEYGEGNAAKPAHSKDIKQYDKQVDGIAATMKGKDEKPKHVEAGSAIETPKSEVGKEYGEKDGNKDSQVGKPGEGTGDHMQGKGNSDDQQTDLPGNKVKVGKVDSDPKVMGEGDAAAPAADASMKQKVDAVPSAGSGEPDMDEAKKKRMAEWKKKRMESLQAKRGQKKEDGVKISDKPEAGAATMGEPAKDTAKPADPSMDAKEGKSMLRRKLPEWAKKK